MDYITLRLLRVLDNLLTALERTHWVGQQSVVQFLDELEAARSLLDELKVAQQRVGQ